jgi:hypothetical protein
MQTETEISGTGLKNLSGKTDQETKSSSVLTAARRRGPRSLGGARRKVQHENETGASENKKQPELGAAAQIRQRTLEFQRRLGPRAD